MVAQDHKYIISAKIWLWDDQMVWFITKCMTISKDQIKNIISVLRSNCPQAVSSDHDSNVTSGKFSPPHAPQNWWKTSGKSVNL